MVQPDPPGDTTFIRVLKKETNMSVPPSAAVMVAEPLSPNENDSVRKREEQ